jgi:hypothetical protein
MTDPNITPPPELVRHWWDNTNADLPVMEFAQAFAAQAARWAADQELEACCTEAGGIAPDMEVARREALHYLAQYGPGHRVELRRVEVIMEAKHG